MAATSGVGVAPGCLDDTARAQTSLLLRTITVGETAHTIGPSQQQDVDTLALQRYIDAIP